MTAGERGAQPVDTEALSPVGWSLIQIGLALPIGAAVLVVLLGLFQSKFLVRLSLLRLDIQRLLVGPLTSGGLGRGLRAFLITLVTLAVVLVSSVVLMPVVSAFLGVDPESFQRVPELFLRVLAFACGVVGVAAAVVLIVVSQLEFRHRNRMSSKEVREEAAD
jgi:flagellar biosynthesis protein FlhB